MARQVPVTMPDATERLCVALISMPTAIAARRRRAGPTRSSRATRPARRELRRAGCRRPACCPRPACVATEYSGLSSRNSMPILRGRSPPPVAESLEQFRRSFRGAVSSSSSVAIVSVRVSEPADRLGPCRTPKSLPFCSSTAIRSHSGRSTRCRSTASRRATASTPTRSTASSRCCFSCSSSRSRPTSRSRSTSRASRSARASTRSTRAPAARPRPSSRARSRCCKRRSRRWACRS